MPSVISKLVFWPAINEIRKTFLPLERGSVRRLRIELLDHLWPTIRTPLRLFLRHEIVEDPHLCDALGSQTHIESFVVPQVLRFFHWYRERHVREGAVA